jgi:UDP-3-O-[3-hydroxymyristoyl] N-acetylglucosamine deacetylase
MIEKRTLKKEVSFSGVGIHSGKKATLTLKPSSRGKILFRRLDLGGIEIEVDPKNVEIRNCVALVSGEEVVQTIEHLMAVLYVFGLDSLEIELNGPEIPVMDGSAAPFAQSILKAGIRPLPEKRKVVKILKAHTLQDNLTSLSFSPDTDFRISYSIDFPHPLIRRQELSLALTREAFLAEITPARTFGFLKDVPELQRRGLAQGGTLENAVVLDDEKVISGPLRFPDEFVRHKILDLIGDLALFGYPLLGHFQADKAGHRLHLKAVLFLLQNPDFWAFEETGFPRHLRS